MADVVVTVPLSFGLDRWIAEGDPAGMPWSGLEWHFYLGGARPNIKPGERVYVVYNGAVRGYAPLVRLEDGGRQRETRARSADQNFALGRLPSGDSYGYALVRRGGAVAVTIPEYVQGFRGFRYRWWGYPQEVPFPTWRDPSACFGWERAPVLRRGARQTRTTVTQRRLM